MSIFPTKYEYDVFLHKANYFGARKTYASHCHNFMRIYLLTFTRCVTDITFPVRQIDIQERWFRPFQIGTFRESQRIEQMKLERNFRHVRAHNDRYVGETNSIFGAKLALVTKHVFANWLTEYAMEYRSSLLRIASLLVHFFWYVK